MNFCKQKHLEKVMKLLSKIFRPTDSVLLKTKQKLSSKSHAVSIDFYITITINKMPTEKITLQISYSYLQTWD